MEVAYFIVGTLLMIAALLTIGIMIFLYFDATTDADRGEIAKWALLSFLLPLLVVAWPITLPVAIITGLVWLVRRMIRSVKTLDNQRTGR